MEDDAVPPSSPPHATTAGPLDSPFTFFEPRDITCSPKSSSPPPLFSSDDSRESADISNYESPRIFKNKRKGGWWDSSEPAHSSPLGVKKARMTRNYDSGVYMMSDASESSEYLPVQHKSPFGLDGTDESPSLDETPAPARLPKGPMTKDEHVFCDNIYEGLDRNSENYDFSFCNLQDQDIQRIGALTSVIKNVPDPGDEIPAEGQYRSLVPELYVTLRNNNLRHLTPALFDVTNITCLILSNNDIEELPSEVRQLSNLRELNVSNTLLRWLPFELLELQVSDGKLEILGDSGVSWLVPKVPQDFDSQIIGGLVDELTRDFTSIMDDPSLTATHYLKRLHQLIDADPNREQLLWHMRRFELWVKECPARTDEPLERTGLFSHHPSVKAGQIPKYLARTPVSYFDKTGILLKGSPISPSSNSDDFEIITNTDRGAHGVPSSIFAPSDLKHVNSLSTMAVHTALRHRHHEDLSISDLREHIGEPLPREARVLLDQAERHDFAGFGAFRKCHVCHREYVVARAEWLEWWIPRFWSVYPYKVKVCSWSCVPDGMRKKPEKELNWQ
ncbi:hypothetical protein CC86DRAFT_82393 [Ophiobolus disseminans]|uniref:L domain-like protein n=1 Tax=Ophiobolus disseminans TaxID=1469910 RepID=A0A6A7AGL1_9PLEO|nr:hypothetical protein CC86DRAFT_82393 [Ophiobolus disseminans]